MRLKWSLPAAFRLALLCLVAGALQAQVLVTLGDNLSSSNVTGGQTVTLTAQVTGSTNTSVTFNLAGFPNSPSSVTPWITSGSLNLAQQTNVSVENGSFTYALPSYSITSFVGVTIAAVAPTPPTGLTATVQ